MSVEKRSEWQRLVEAAEMAGHLSIEGRNERTVVQSTDFDRETAYEESIGRPPTGN